MISGVSGYSAYSYSSAASSRPKPPDPAQMQEKLFQTLDSNTDGSISKEELGSAVSAAQESDSSLQIDIDELFSQLDANADSTLDSAETAALLPPPPPPPGGMDPEALMAGADSDSDGSLSIDELGSALGIRTDDSERLQALFDELDSDADGSLSTSEASRLAPPPPPEGPRGAPGAEGASSEGQSQTSDGSSLITLLLKQYSQVTAQSSSLGSSLDLCA